mmetsp:Transcript_11164/g.17252  ORF Transcript_11164/g.17252 Transcript_11164/m.17252 type:complete len:526 (+) Transcript_11164:26-1603(+)
MDVACRFSLAFKRNKFQAHLNMWKTKVLADRLSRGKWKGPLVSSVANNFSTMPQNRPRVVILGSGWGGNTLARRLDKKRYDVRLISPANHFLFTPLLPSTAVGTLEFRAIQEPVRTIKGLGEYYQAKARGLDTEKQIVECEDLFKNKKFKVQYDYLCIAAGNKTNTFNTPGVAEREGHEVFFLKHLYHARAIRNRVLECFERASSDDIAKEERDRLLSFVVVGGGPTSCEFMSELYDFLRHDVSKWYPDLINDIRLTLVEAGPGLLGSFDKSLADYYLEQLLKKQIDVRLGTAVTGVEERIYHENETQTDSYTVALFADDTELPFSTMVWSAGLAPVKFIETSNLELGRGGKILVDKHLRVKGHKGRIFALGDCAIVEDGPPLPPTASVAEQEAYYIGDCFNKFYHKFDPSSEENKEVDLPLPGPVVPALLPWEYAEFLNRYFVKAVPYFEYKNRGAMTSMGFGGGVFDTTKTDLPMPEGAFSGVTAFLAWRSAYWTKQLSWTNMILIPMYWFKAMLFGRDISRF